MLHICNAQYSPEARLMCLTHHDPDEEDESKVQHLLYREFTQAQWDKLCSFDEDATEGNPAYQYWAENIKGQYQEREMSDHERMLADIMGLQVLALA